MVPSNKLNLASQRFGKLIAIKDTGKRYRGLAIWQCKCDCGNTCEVTSNHLRTGHTTSCGCRLGNRNDLTNQRFGRLVVKEYVGRVNNNTMWKCICDCGNEVVVNAYSLRNGKTRSCGCLNTEVRSSTAKDRFGFVDGTTLSSISSSRKINKNNSTGVRGVSFDKKRKKWVAQITFQRKNYCLGRFDKKEDAINARLEGEERFFGKYRKDGK